MDLKKSLIIKTPHTKSEIYGFGFSEFSNIFWWFGDGGKILYHYQDENKITRTQYLELPKGVNNKNYNILGFLEDSNSLVLNAT